MPTDERPPPLSRLFSELADISGLTGLRSVWRQMKTDWREAGEEDERAKPWVYAAKRERQRIAIEMFKGTSGESLTSDIRRWQAVSRQQQKLRDHLHESPSGDGPANE